MLSNAILAFLIIMFLNSFKGWQMDLDPVNVYYWLFVGLLLKMPVLQQEALANEVMKEYPLARCAERD